MTKQQEIERHWFEMFRKVYSLPAGRIGYGDRPDVIVYGHQNVGIEITHFYVTDGALPESEQVQRRRREAAVSEAQRLHQRSGGYNIELAFGFEKMHPILDVPEVARKLVNLGRRVQSAENGQLRRDAFSDIPELDFVYLHARALQYNSDLDPEFPSGSPDPSLGFAAYREYWNRREMRALREGIYKPLQFPVKWTVVQSHNFGLMSKERLTEIIRAKEGKAQHYTTCDSYWLLIVVDFMDSAQEQEIRIDGFTIDSGVFKKIIVYKPYFEHILELVRENNCAV